MKINPPKNCPKILIISGVWPHIKANREAANVISYLIIDNILNDKHFDVSYMYLNFQPQIVPDEAASEINSLSNRGVKFHEKIIPIKKNGRKTQVLRMIKGLMPGSGKHGAIIDVIKNEEVDAILTIWSEFGTQVASGLDIPVYAYYGNPEPKVLDARLTLNRQFKDKYFLEQIRSKFLNWLVVKFTEYAHLKVMRKLKFVFEVAKNDAEYYQSHGVSSSYLNNIWPGDLKGEYNLLRDIKQQGQIIKICGNVGKISATGNSFGLITIANEILPKLKKRLGKGMFEIHLYGGGELNPKIAKLLNDSHIKIRGFVDDLDAEIASSDIFLIANNHNRFKVGHTRFMHAWSLGSTVVAFDDCCLAMPEIKDNENALLGKTVDEIIEHICSASANVSLRKKLAKGGQRTLIEHFSPKKVVNKIVKHIYMDLKNIKAR